MPWARRSAGPRRPPGTIPAMSILRIHPSGPKRIMAGFPRVFGGSLPTRVIIMGAAGRDFHDFNIVFRDDPGVEVVAFTATQIPNIEGRRYPPELAGPRYPEGIPIHPEAELRGADPRARRRPGGLRLQRRLPRDRDAQGLAGAGRRRRLPADRAATPACSGRGCRSSRSARCARARQEPDHAPRGPHPAREGPAGGRRPPPDALRRPGAPARAALRAHGGPRPARAAPSRSARSTSRTSRAGGVVYAGVDYAAILAEAERGGRRRSSGTAATTTCRSIVPDLEIVVADPHRPGHECRYHPGEANLRRAARRRHQQDRHGRPPRASRPCGASLRELNPRRDGRRRRLADHGRGPGGDPRQARAGRSRTVRR